MGKFAVGDIVLVNFPFSNLRHQKHRPGIVVARADFGDVIVCQITSNPYAAKHSVKITRQDFRQGSLPVNSYARPDKLFTFSELLIVRKLAALKQNKKQQILSELRTMFSTG